MAPTFRSSANGRTTDVKTLIFPSEDGRKPCNGSGACEVYRSSSPYTLPSTTSSTTNGISPAGKASRNNDLLPSSSGSKSSLLKPPSLINLLRRVRVCLTAPCRVCRLLSDVHRRGPELATCTDKPNTPIDWLPPKPIRGFWCGVSGQTPEGREKTLGPWSQPRDQARWRYPGCCHGTPQAGLSE